VSVRSSWSRLLVGRWLRIVGLTGTALVGGLAESVVLVVVVQTAVALSGQRTGVFKVGPVQLESVSVSVLLILALVATVIRLVGGLLVSWVGSRLTADVQQQLRIQMFDAYVDAEWSAQSREREGGLQQMIGVEIDRVAVAVLTLASGLAAVCSLLMLIGVALLVNPLGAASLVLVIGSLFLLLRPLTRRARAQATTRTVEELGIAQSLNELVRTAEEIRVHGVGTERKRRLAAETREIAKWATRLNFTALSLSHLYQAAALGLVVAALFVVNQIGASSIAGAGAIVLILLRAFAYSQQLQQTYHHLGERVASVETVFNTLADYQASATRPGRSPLASIDVIEFQGVSYSYRANDEALSNVSFVVPQGEVIGVVGPSGAGKSTLVQILLRLRDPAAGRYLVNGMEAADYVGADWARLVSYLPQQPKLISGTVLDNIRFFRGVKDEEVEAAARMAYLHDEIVTWSEGYKTVIGDRFDALSGGQAQRLCLARALVTKPALLVLDEPTSALDAKSEYYVQQALGELRDKTTIFIIAHRLSTLNICDRLLVLKDGRVEGLETRERLASEAGFYREALRMSGLT
jgi:ATP-binding cassette subfamily B protein